MKRPLASNFDAVNVMPYTAVGDIFFHWFRDKLWRNKLVKFEPTNLNHEITVLRDDICMDACRICQIALDIIKFSHENKNTPTEVLRIQNLSSGRPTQTAIPPFKSRIVAFSLDVDKMRDIYISGGFIDDYRKPMTKVQKLNTHIEEYNQIPSLIHARC